MSRLLTIGDVGDKVTEILSPTENLSPKLSSVSDGIDFSILYFSSGDKNDSKREGYEEMEKGSAGTAIPPPFQTNAEKVVISVTSVIREQNQDVVGDKIGDKAKDESCLQPVTRVTGNSLVTLRAWISTLFDSEDHIWAEYGGTFSSYSRHQNDLFYRLEKDATWHTSSEASEGFKVALNASRWLKDVRKGENVDLQKIRNFMFEFDGGTPQEQADVIKKSGLPFTSVVHSGNKSLHVVVSLAEVIPFEDFKPTWKKIQKVLQGYCSGEVTCDPQTSQLAQWMRAPFGTRMKNGECKPQKLLKLNGRIPNKTLEEWLYKPEHYILWFERTKRLYKRNDDIKTALRVKLLKDFFGAEFEGQAYTECPLCGGNFSVNFNEGLVHCFRGCDWRNILGAITPE